MLKKTIYTYQNLIILKNGASIRLQNLNNLNNLKLFVDNYDSYYLSKLINKSINKKKIFKKTQTYTFFKKFKF